MYLRLLLVVFIFNAPTPCKSDTVLDDLLNLNQIIDILGELPAGLINTCTEQLAPLGTALRKQEMWALKMVDATAKPQAGLLKGNVLHLGNYDECLEIDEKVDKKRIQGKYCSAFFQPHPEFGKSLETIFGTLMETFSRTVDGNDTDNSLGLEGLRMLYGFCVPRDCFAQDLQLVANYIENVTQSPLHFSFVEQFCQDDDLQYTPGATAAIMVFSLFAVILLWATAYDAFFHKKLTDGEQPTLLLAFSVSRNFKKLLSTSTAEGNFQCLNGIRVISMMWIILCHDFMFNFFTPHTNAIDILKWRNQTINSFVPASAFAVDTFFFVSGFLVVYLFFKSQSKGIKFSLPLYYLHRILRLTPSLVMIVLLSATLLPYMGDGPFWPVIIDVFHKPCVNNWWSTLIYLQNYINPDEQCVGQSWYLAVDTQMYFLAPLIFLSLVKWPRRTISAIVIFIILNCSYVFEITWKKQFGTTFYNEDLIHYRYLYSPTHVRGTAYLMGMLCGYFIYQTKASEPLKLTKVIVFSLWIVSVGTLAVVVVSHTWLVTAPEYNVLDSSLFNSLARIGWSTALSIIIVLCINDYGGPINSFLSSNIFNILIKVNYNVYLLHLLVMSLIVAKVRVSTYFSNALGYHNFWGDYILSVAASTVWTLAFESPVITIEKILFTKGMSVFNFPLKDCFLGKSQNRVLNNGSTENGEIVLPIADNISTENKPKNYKSYHV